MSASDSDERAASGPRAVGIRAILLGLVVVAGVVASGRLVESWPRVDGDGVEYVVMADNIASSGVFSRGREDQAPLEPTIDRVPGYPFFMVVVTLGGRLPLAAVGVAQLLLHFIGGTLLALGLVQLGIPGRWAWAVAVTAVALPPLSFFPHVVLTETLATWLGTMAGLLACLALASPIDSTEERQGPRAFSPFSPSALAFAAGTTVGVATLVRPEFLVLLPALVGIMAAARALRLRRALLVLAGGLVVIAPWTVRNAVHTGRFIPVSDPWTVVSRGYHSWVMSWMDHPRYVDPLYWNVVGRGEPYVPGRFPPHAFGAPGDEAVVDGILSEIGAIQELVGTPQEDRFAELASARLRQEPFQVLLVRPVRRMFTAWTRLTSTIPGLPGGGPRSEISAGMAVKLLLAGTHLLLLVGGLAGAVLTLMPRYWVFLPFSALVGFRLALVGWVIHPEPRYMLEALPAALVLSALAARHFLGRTESGRFMGY